MSNDFTTYDAILPPEYQEYQKQYEIPLPDDYYDVWQQKLSEYEPVRDETLLIEGVMQCSVLPFGSESILENLFQVVQGPIVDFQLGSRT